MKKITLVLMCLMISIAGCATNTTTEPVDQKLSVVSTIGMIHDVVKNIGGEHIDAIGMMGPGVDPHLYKPTEGDIGRLSNADVIFYNGLHLEAQMGEVLEQMTDKTVVVVTKDVDESKLLTPPDFDGYNDPHIWFDVSMWKEIVPVITETLKQADPDHAQAYDQNAATYLSRLDTLQSYVEEQVALVPSSQRVLVTAHDAFNYFGQAYGFEVKGLQGISTEAEAGTKDVQELVDFIVQREIKAIFVESSISERNVKAVQEGAQAQGWDVQIGGELFSDAMGDEGTVEGTYIGMVEHNIDTIVGALS